MRKLALIAALAAVALVAAAAAWADGPVITTQTVTGTRFVSRNRV